MRPRRFRRGNRHAVQRAIRDAVRSFNEAPAIPPGKPIKAYLDIQGGERASMRPRRFRRGNRHAVQRAIRDAVRSFNEAPAIPPGKPGTRSRRAASPRPSFNEAPAIPPGKPAFSRSVYGGAGDMASMRPRRFRRGNRVRWSARLAMNPRLQ